MIAEILAVSAGVFGHTSSKKFVSRKLRFTSIVEKPRLGLGLATGCVAAVAAAPVVAILPVVGAGTALLFGAGIGTGVAMGAKKARGKADGGRE